MMKKYSFFCLIFLAGVSLGLKAQNFRGGFKLGLNASQVRGDLLSGFDKAGLIGGLTLELPLKHEDFLQMELLFTQKGSRRNPTKDSYKKYIMRLNYIELPISYYKIFGSKYGVQAGLSFAYLIKNTGIEWDENGFIPSATPFNEFEFAGHAGLFYQMNENSRFNLRYSMSILPVRPHSSGQTYYMNLGQTNLVLSLTYEYRF